MGNIELNIVGTLFTLFYIGCAVMMLIITIDNFKHKCYDLAIPSLVTCVACAGLAYLCANAWISEVLLH